jgi:hypothetical protein
MSPMLAVATASVQDTEKLVTFMRYYFGRIGYKYELHADA